MVSRWDGEEKRQASTQPLTYSLFPSISLTQAVFHTPPPSPSPPCTHAHKNTPKWQHLIQNDAFEGNPVLFEEGVVCGEHVV